MAGTDGTPTPPLSFVMRMQLKKRMQPKELGVRRGRSWDPPPLGKLVTQAPPPREPLRSTAEIELASQRTFRWDAFSSPVGAPVVPVVRRPPARRWPHLAGAYALGVATMMGISAMPGTDSMEVAAVRFEPPPLAKIVTVADEPTVERGFVLANTTPQDELVLEEHAASLETWDAVLFSYSHSPPSYVVPATPTPARAGWVARRMR